MTPEVSIADRIGTYEALIIIDDLVQDIRSYEMRNSAVAGETVEYAERLQFWVDFYVKKVKED